MSQSTDKKFVCDLNTLIKQGGKKRSTLKDAPDKNSIGASTGTAYESDNAVSGGNAAGWPLTETSREESVRTLTSDDGITEVDIADCTSITFEDDNGDERVMNFNPPTS